VSLTLDQIYGAAFNGETKMPTEAEAALVRRATDRVIKSLGFYISQDGTVRKVPNLQPPGGNAYWGGDGGVRRRR
jgi:hypothetical protein